MGEVGGTEQSADQALVRRVNALICAKTPAALAEARELMPAYVEASARLRAAARHEQAMVEALRIWAGIDDKPA